MKKKSVIALMIVLCLFIWLSFYFVLINSQVAQYGILRLYEPNPLIGWLEFAGGIAMLTLGIYVLSKFVRRKM